MRELFRYIPSVQGENIRPQSRGLQAGVVQNTRIDGLNIAATTDYAIEQFDRIEVLNGLSGALYGPASPAGTFNYVFKRPTAAPLNAFTLAYASQDSLIEHADLSRRFGPDGMFGLRLNLLNQAGQNYVDDSGLKRRLISLAAAIRLQHLPLHRHGLSRHLLARPRRPLPRRAGRDQTRLRLAVGGR